MRRVRRVVVAAAVWLLARSGMTWAADDAAEEPAVRPSAEEEPAAVPRAEQPAPPPRAVAMPAASQTVEEEPRARPSAEEKWPIEAVRRPLTLPAGMQAVGFALEGFRPKHTINGNPLTGTTYTFNSGVTAGVSLALGLTDRVQVAVTAPRLLCFDEQRPSVCSENNRYNNTGGGVRILALRRDGVPIAPSARVTVSLSSPVVLKWWAGALFKLTASNLAFTVGPTLARDINTVPARPQNPWLAYVPVWLELQAAQRVLVFAVVEPWGSLGDVARGILLEVYGGASYTFGPLAQIELSGGTYNVLAQPSWNTNVPEWFAALSLVFWRH